MYKCNATNTNNDPATATAYWSKAFVDSTAYLEKIKDLAVVNNTTSVINGSGVATNVPYGSVGLSLLAASTQAAGRTAIGAQQLNTHLTALAGLTSATNLLPYFNGVGTMTTTNITAFGRSLLDDVDAAAGRTTLGLSGQSLLALNALSGASDTLPWFDSVSTMQTTPLTAMGRSLVGAADAAAVRRLLSLLKTSSTSDATKGALLQCWDFGVGGWAVTLPSNDFNLPGGSGFWQNDNSVAYLNGPPQVANTTPFVMTQVTYAATSKVQTAVSVNTNRAFRRTQLSGVWSDWQDINPQSYGLGGSTPPLIADFNNDYPPGFYRAYGALNAQATPGAPTDSSNTALTVLAMRGLSSHDFTTYLVTTAQTTAPSVWIGGRVSGGAFQWRRIDPQAYGLGQSTTPVTSDLNDISVSGFYRFDVSSLNIPFNYGTVLSTVRTSNEQTQMAISNTTRLVAFRTKAGGVWGSWDYAYTRNTVLGTVSQSAGVPTGAIIERGSNANGSYVKFADGTMICYLQATTSTFAASGGVFVSNAVVSTLPATFVTAGDMVVTGNDATNSTFWITGLSNNVSTITTVAWASALPSVTTRTLRLCVTGRWY